MLLVLSIIFGVLPLAGIAWTLSTGTASTVDGLFMVLILLALSGILFLNAYWQYKWMRKKAAAQQAQKTS
jgi:hypothetical protein